MTDIANCFDIINKNSYISRKEEQIIHYFRKSRGNYYF